MTLVGQSGPPHKMTHFPNDNPGLLSTDSIARTKGLCTPHICRTDFQSPSLAPMRLCCTAQAVSFSTKHKMMQMMEPHQKPKGHLPEITKPPNKYIGGPGTGGIMNKTIPAAKVNARMTMKFWSPINALIQASITFRSGATNFQMKTTQDQTYNHRTTDSHSQSCKPAKAMPTLSVRILLDGRCAFGVSGTAKARKPPSMLPAVSVRDAAPCGSSWGASTSGLEKSAKPRHFLTSWFTADSPRTKGKIGKATVNTKPRHQLLLLTLTAEAQSGRSLSH
eukprot:CAMPEP_0206544350 /NCGR_PEP_ID=MMETSP0325_2-20121206/11465_1 /ASSEMBLY_ACC=CAM_ASM_000347 /TAXON_ID=2866 /ORGANISM="Crypthecodinium cohnii, Strain Seligo" /LENGTH=277 /DNA_ID=CAMNT_0054043081 /DNA_START=604 /DNA_END=1434 /DNA_ORIENTATION=+